MAKIYNKETGLKSNNNNNKKTINSSQTQQDSFLSSSSSSNATTSSIISDIENKNNSNNISNSMYSHIKDFDLLESLTSIYNKNEIEGTFKILGKMLPFIEELDSLLSKHNPANRIDILSNVILSSLTPSNPISSLKDYINIFKIVIGIEKASTIISQSQKISKEQAKIALRSFISSAPYSKNKFKQNPDI